MTASSPRSRGRAHRAHAHLERRPPRQVGVSDAHVRGPSGDAARGPRGRVRAGGGGSGFLRNEPNLAPPDSSDEAGRVNPVGTGDCESVAPGMAPVCSLSLMTHAGGESLANVPPVGQAKNLGRQRAHLADGVFRSWHPLVTHVVSQDASRRRVVPRMGNATRAEIDRRPIAGHRHPRLPHHQSDIVLSTSRGRCR